MEAYKRAELYKSYLGDGVYASRDDRGLILTTENGTSVTNTIVLEPSVLHALWEYLKIGKKYEKESSEKE